MKTYFVYTADEVKDPIDLFDAIDSGMYADTAERAKELALDLTAESHGEYKVYKLSCEEVL